MYYVNNATAARELLTALIGAGYTGYSVKGNGVVYHHGSDKHQHGHTASTVMTQLELDYASSSRGFDVCNGVSIQLNPESQNISLTDLLIKVEKALG